jgi:hypothetical protein
MVKWVNFAHCDPYPYISTAVQACSFSKVASILSYVLGPYHSDIEAVS